MTKNKYHEKSGQKQPEAHTYTHITVIADFPKPAARRKTRGYLRCGAVTAAHNKIPLIAAHAMCPYERVCTLVLPPIRVEP